MIDTLIDMLAVSIHAPARGATRDKQDLNVDAKVSIHAPARGATYDSLCNIERI